MSKIRSCSVCLSASLIQPGFPSRSCTGFMPGLEVRVFRRAWAACKCLGERQQALSTRHPGQGCPARTGELHQPPLGALHFHAVHDGLPWMPGHLVGLTTGVYCCSHRMSGLDVRVFWRAWAGLPRQAPRAAATHRRLPCTAQGTAMAGLQRPHDLQVSLDCLLAVIQLCQWCL